jgi:hypothetical protein
MLFKAAARMSRTRIVPIQRPAWRAGTALICSAATPVFAAAPGVETFARPSSSFR